jgi:hypothetical protein
MKDIIEFMISLQRRSVSIWVEDERLCYRAPKGVLSGEELGRLVDLKTQIVAALDRTELASEIPLQPRAAASMVPLTPMQTYLRSLLGNGPSRRLSSFALRVGGSLSIRLLGECVNALVQRHESLRTRIVGFDAIGVQQIDPSEASPLELIDLAGVAQRSRETEARRVVEQLVAEDVDLAAGPLFCPKILRLSDDDYVLIMGLDHMITDGVSNEIMNTDLWFLYRQKVTGSRVMLPALPVQFGDYATWLQRSTPGWIRRHKAYWDRLLVRAPKVPMPRSLEGACDSARCKVCFDEILSNKLRAVAREERVLLCLVILTIYVVGMSRWLSRQDLVVLFPANGRDHPSVNGMVGFLAHHVFLRLEINSEDRWCDLLAKVNAEYQAACYHNDFGRVQALFPDISSDVYFNWTSASGIRLSLEKPWQDAGITLQVFPFKPAWQATFAGFFSDSDVGVVGEVAYRTDLFSVAAVERFAQMIRGFAEEFVERPWSPVSRVSQE